MEQELNNIEIRIKTLIDLFKEIQNQQLEKSFEVLKQIFKLRKQQNPDYNLSDLENEKGLEQHRESIRPIWRFGNITDKIVNYKYSGKLNPSEVFHLANVTGELRENQDELADMLVNKEITTEDLKPSNAYFLMKKLKRNPMKEEQRIILNTIYNLDFIGKTILKYKSLLIKQKYKKLLKIKFNHLKIIVDNLLKE